MTAQALARISGDPEQVVPVLAGLLSDPDPQVRLAGAEGLRQQGEAAVAAVPQIVAALPLTGKPLERRKIDRNNPIGR